MTVLDQFLQNMFLVGIARTRIFFRVISVILGGGGGGPLFSVIIEILMIFILSKAPYSKLCEGSRSVGETCAEETNLSSLPDVKKK